MVGVVQKLTAAVLVFRGSIVFLVLRQCPVLEAVSLAGRAVLDANGRGPYPAQVPRLVGWRGKNMVLCK